MSKNITAPSKQGANSIFLLLTFQTASVLAIISIPANMRREFSARHVRNKAKRHILKIVGVVIVKRGRGERRCIKIVMFEHQQHHYRQHNVRL